MSGVHVQIVEASPNHVKDSTCPCSPRLEIIEESNGQTAWAYIHSALPFKSYMFNGSIVSSETAGTITIDGTLTPDAVKALYGYESRKGIVRG